MTYKFIKELDYNTMKEVISIPTTRLIIRHRDTRYRYSIVINHHTILNTNDKSAIMIWMDLNGKKTVGTAYIFIDRLIKNDKNYCVIGLKDK